MIADESRQWNLRGATGKPRTEKRDGREYLVVPIVALMEGVIHPVNAESPEFVPIETLKRAATSWNGRPVTIGHPVKNGTQCSANDPEIFETHVIGTIFNSHVEGKKLLQEAWIEKEKTRKLDADMYELLASNKTVEVSVGALVHTVDGAGEFDDKKFLASWAAALGDHLAFLPGGRGACSVKMGCGTNRAAMHLVAAASIETVPEELPALIFSALEDVPLNDQINAVYNAVYERWKKDVAQTVSTAYPMQIFDDYVIVSVEMETYSVPYEMKDGKAVLGTAKKVKQAWVAATGRYEDCATCTGSGNKDGNPCLACDGRGEIRVAAGARHSTKDVKLIQAVHDNAMALGAMCDRGNYTAAEAKPPLRTLTIRHEGGKWVLYTKDGSRRLGSHSTEAEAIAQERAIEAAKHRRTLELAASR